MMPTSKVYFTDLRTQIGVSQLDKLEKLIRAAGIGDIDFDHKMTAIKIHFGEPGNLTYLRPNYAKRVADVIKSLGGLPFLTDCNTLYPGRRKNALEHIESAYENGFTPLLHRLSGDHRRRPEGERRRGGPGPRRGVREGRQDRPGHHGRRHFHQPEPLQGPRDDRFRRDHQEHRYGLRQPPGQDGAARGGKAYRLGRALRGLPPVRQAVRPGRYLLWRGQEGFHRPQKVCGLRPVHRLLQLRRHFGGKRRGYPRPEPKDGRVRKAVVDGRPQFHISLVIDVSPYCDCHGENDMAILPDVGMFASFDPVALDQACADACLKQEPIPRQPAGRQHARRWFLRPPRPLQEYHPGDRLEELSGARRENWPGQPQL